MAMRRVPHSFVIRGWPTVSQVRYPEHLTAISLRSIAVGELGRYTSTRQNTGSEK